MASAALWVCGCRGVGGWGGRAGHALLLCFLPWLPSSHQFPPPFPPCWRAGGLQVSFGVFESEDEAARQYDRALILEKGRAAKTNFAMRDYEAEAAAYEAHLART